jgi:hypothetical protein
MSLVSSEQEQEIELVDSEEEGEENGKNMAVNSNQNELLIYCIL